MKGQFKLLFNKNQDCKYLLTDMINKTTNLSWSNYLRKANDSLTEVGYRSNHIAEMDIITLAHKRDMTYDFYSKHNMSAFERKLNVMINTDKNLINKFPRNWRHPINLKLNCYQKNIIYMEFVKEYVFYNINFEDVDEIIVKASSDCSDGFIHSYSSCLIFNVKIIDENDNKTKDKVFEYTLIGRFLFLCRMREMG